MIWILLLWEENTTVAADSPGDEIVELDMYLSLPCLGKIYQEQKKECLCSLVSLTFLCHAKGAYPNRTQLFSPLLW